MLLFHDIIIHIKFCLESKCINLAFFFDYFFFIYSLCFILLYHILLIGLGASVSSTSDDAYSSTGTWLERMGSLGWTKEANGRDWRMPDCLWRDRINAC